MGDPGPPGAGDRRRARSGWHAEGSRAETGGREAIRGTCTRNTTRREPRGRRTAQAAPAVAPLARAERPVGVEGQRRPELQAAGGGWWAPPELPPGEGECGPSRPEHAPRGPSGKPPDT